MLRQKSLFWIRTEKLWVLIAGMCLSYSCKLTSEVESNTMLEKRNTERTWQVVNLHDSVYLCDMFRSVNSCLQNKSVAVCTEVKVEVDGTKNTIKDALSFYSLNVFVMYSCLLKLKHFGENKCQCQSWDPIERGYNLGNVMSSVTTSKKPSSCILN